MLTIDSICKHFTAFQNICSHVSNSLRLQTMYSLCSRFRRNSHALYLEEILIIDSTCTIMPTHYSITYNKYLKLKSICSQLAKQMLTNTSICSHFKGICSLNNIIIMNIKYEHKNIMDKYINQMPSIHVIEIYKKIYLHIFIRF